MLRTRKAVLLTTGIAMMVLAFPLTAANPVVNLGGATLTPGTTFNFDTVASGTSGGDILWSGTALTLQGKATAFNLGTQGQAGQSALTYNELMALGAAYTSAPIPASSLVVNDVFAVKSNGGNYAAVW